jgi:hypothetical protein
MGDYRDKEALDLVARHVADKALDAGSPVEPLWENYPELSEEQWFEVERRLDKMRDDIGCADEEYHAAYEFLGGRADAE